MAKIYNSLLTTLVPFPKNLSNGVATESSLCLPLPMRGGKFIAQVIVPRDMTKGEADRLCKFVLSLAAPEDQ